MRSLIFLICLFLTPISSHGQGDSILDFFDNIFSISSLIENENKDRLQRELKLFAKKADQLIALKKETSISMLAYCADEEGNDTELNSKTGAFDKLVRRSVGHLENIRENVIFESDYDIIVDTFYRPTPVEDTITLHLDPGCYLQTDTNFITEEVIPEGFDMTTQNIMPVICTVQ